MITQDDLQGHWQREWIVAPGFEDRTTRVHWLQAGSLFADLRIPLERPDLAGSSCLADLTPAALRVLMDAEGFGGHITVEDKKCTWHREINWHGVPDQPDVGLMSFDDTGGLIEDGVLIEYRELWQTVPQPPLSATKVRCGAMKGILIESDTEFLLGIGPVPSGPRNVDTTEGAALQLHFASAYIWGKWDGAQGIATLATNPFYEGQVAIERGEHLVWHSVAFDGTREVRPLMPAGVG